MTQDFLLNTKTGRELYHHVSGLPIIDWHNHLGMEDLAKNSTFENMTHLWIASDPYKHRAMRICGVEEALITGNAGDFEKFQAWSRTLPRLIGNPLYHWSMLELERVFGISGELNEHSAKTIWETANAKLGAEGLRARDLLNLFHVEYAAPCRSLLEQPGTEGAPEGIVPSLRADDLCPPDLAKIHALEQLTGTEISDLDSFRNSISIRMDVFHKAGCRFSDHALDGGFHYHPDDGKNAMRFAALLQGKRSEEDLAALSSEMLRILAGEYAKRRWTLQLHIGAQRHTSERLRRLAGPAGGYSGIGHPCDIPSLLAMLNDFEKNPDGGLPRTILYTLNPADNAALSVLSGSFSEDHIQAKVQAGPAWWFCDHIYGMKQCFEHTAAYGVLSTFAGMTTDSRSLLSFVRHEYFRRVFCAWLGEKAEQGEYPSGGMKLENLAEAVCYGNAKKIITSALRNEIS